MANQWADELVTKNAVRREVTEVQRLVSTVNPEVSPGTNTARKKSMTPDSLPRCLGKNVQADRRLSIAVTHVQKGQENNYELQ